MSEPTKSNDTVATNRDVYAVIRVSTMLRKKDGTVYMTGTEHVPMTIDLQARLKNFGVLYEDDEIAF